MKKASETLIEIKPQFHFDPECPRCDETLECNDIEFAGMRVLAEGVCPFCKTEYYADLRTGHGLLYPFLISKGTQKIYPRDEWNWFSAALQKSITSKPWNQPTEIVREKQNSDCCIVLTTVDQCYGHSLLKLLNAQYHLDQHPHCDLVVILQPFLRWMLPPEVENVVQVSLPLNEGWKKVKDLDGIMADILSKYDKVYVSKNHPHVFQKEIRISDFVAVQPYDLDRKDEEKPICITYVWRSDRTIYDTCLWAKAFNKLSRFPIASALNNIVLWKQKCFVDRLFSVLNAEFANLDFAVTGTEKNIPFSTEINDLRSEHPTHETEKNWAKRYSESTVVIGVHGSNMLLPSALARSVLELLPADRLGNYLQDLLIRKTDYKDVLFRYRHLILPCSVNTVASVTKSLLTDYASFTRWSKNRFKNDSDE